MKRRKIVGLVGLGIVSGCSSPLNDGTSAEVPPKHIEITKISCKQDVKNHSRITYNRREDEYDIVELSGTVKGESTCETLDMNVFHSLERENEEAMKIEIHSMASEEQCQECISKIDFIAQIHVKNRPTRVGVEYYNRGQFVDWIGHNEF